MFKSFLFFFPIGFMLSSCVTDQSVVSYLHPSPTANLDYFETIESHTKQMHVSESLETVYKLNITELGDSVMMAFDSRFQELFSRQQDLINPEKGEVVFFVSLFAPNSREADLANKQEWFSSYSLSNKKLKASRVVRLKKSRLWGNFFPYIDDYSREFLLYFDASSLKDSKGLQETRKVLTLSNSRAKTIITW